MAATMAPKKLAVSSLDAQFRTLGRGIIFVPPAFKLVRDDRDHRRRLMFFFALL
jgi:hypothetical protein